MKKINTKRLLFYAQTLGSGGAERQMIALASLLKDKGYNVSFFCAKDDICFYQDSLSNKGIQVTYSRYKRGFNKAHIYAIIHQIVSIYEFVLHVRRCRIETVISFLPSCNFVACCAKLFTNFHLITGERSSKMDTFVSRRGKLQAFFQRKADVIVCNSFNAQNLWVQYYPKYRNKITTIYNLIPDFQNDPDIESFCHPWLKVVVMASYQVNKNPTKFIKALSLLTDEERNILKVDWWGEKCFNESQFDICLKMVDELGLSDVICLHGVTKNAFEKIKHSDVVALVSDVEGLPNTICEGMMLGKPIIMSKVSDYNILVDGTNGFLCDSSKEESIANALSSAIHTSRRDLVEMGNNSRNKAKRLFSNDVIIEQWTKIIG